MAVIWWFWRPPSEAAHHTAQADDVAAYPGRIVVDFQDGVSDARVAEIAAHVGIDLQLVSRQSLDERMYRADVPAERVDAVLAALSALPEVEIAEADADVQLIEPLGSGIGPLPGDPDDKWAGFPNDPQYKYQWHLVQIGMPAAWKKADGKGVTVAVIDTGVAYENYKNFHQVPDLAGVEFVKPWNFVANNEHADDDHGHGTHVAGTIAQATHNGIGVAGIARAVKIMPLKVLSAGGSGSVAAIADAIRYAADEGAQVINMSLGGRFRSRVLEKAVKYAHDKGVVVVCAAGNDGQKRVSYPAAYPGAVAVAATQYDETTTFYSNFGPEIDVAAPGGNTQVDQNGDGMPDGVLQNTIVVGDPTQDGYFPFMGTSMASPHVAGVAALIVGEGVTDPDAVEKILEETARKPKGGKMDAIRYGAGIIDAPGAVDKARADGGAWQLALGLLVAGAVLSQARRRAGIAAGPLYLVGALVGAGGLFFLPGIIGRGFPAWDIAVFGAAAHGNPLFYSALAPVLLAVVGGGARWLRGLVAGFSAGVGAHLLFHMAARTADIRFIPGSTLDTLWLGANAALCFLLAIAALRE
ncbi:MAG TPA: S8 family peptidase [Haliangiales bacterium]|nr:S8 family peptidase [Haliangiales bacterium]